MAVGGLVQSVYSLAIHNTTREPERYLITEYSRLKFKIAPVKIYSAAGSGMGKPEKEEVRHDNAIQRHDTSLNHLFTIFIFLDVGSVRQRSQG